MPVVGVGAPGLTGVLHSEPELGELQVRCGDELTVPASNSGVHSHLGQPGAKKSVAECRLGCRIGPVAEQGEYGATLVGGDASRMALDLSQECVATHPHQRRTPSPDQEVTGDKKLFLGQKRCKVTPGAGQCCHTDHPTWQHISGLHHEGVSTNAHALRGMERGRSGEVGQRVVFEVRRERDAPEASGRDMGEKCVLGAPTCLGAKGAEPLGAGILLLE